MLAIPQTRLWTPRQGPWWRLPRFDSLLMAHLKKGAGGHLLKNAAGHLVKDCGSDPCSECATGTTPATIRGVVSGVTLCGTCKSSLAALLDVDVSASVDGTFDAVQQSGTPCFYQVKLFDINTYSFGSGCTGSPVGTTGVYLNITLQSTTVQVAIGFTLPTGFGSVEFDFFSGTISVSSGYDCAASRTATNSTSCAGGDVGENGTVDIVGV